MEICASTVAQTVAQTVTKIGECLWSFFQPKICYLIQYESNVVNLRSQVEYLVRQSRQVQNSVDIARRNGEPIKPLVEAWLTSVGEIETKTRRLTATLDENRNCFNGWRPNCRSRYILGKKAKKMMLAVKELEQRGNFNRVSEPLPPPSIESMPTADFVAFRSTKLAIEQVMDALKDEKISVVGVFGMGGAGKTTLMAQAAIQMKKEKLYNEVVMVTISRYPDLKKIQGELAEKLGLKFQEENESVRASRLSERLKLEEKILIILDDLWGSLDLHKVGIPHGDDHKGCKIVLTTRSRAVCNTMASQTLIDVQVLSGDDSWALFKRNAGDLIESPTFLTVAKNVVKECGGLPLAITALGKALRDRDILYWKDALVQLKRSSTANIEGLDDKVFKSLVVSYDSLGSEEVKLCFLFCSLFPEDHNIEMEVLMRYGIGEGFCKNVMTLEEARGRVHTLVDNLQASCLLLDGDREGCVKMHDIVRDVAINIASKDGLDFFIRAGEGLSEGMMRESLAKCRRISLMRNKITMLPNCLECSQLVTLLLGGNNSLKEISNSFFEGMESLAVLDLSNTHISLLPLSLSYQTNLRTLCLDYCSNLTDISHLSGLKKLEILCLRSSSIEKLPEDIGKLANLKFIDLTDCRELKILPSNVLSKLSQLEELFMGNSFRKWELKGSRDCSKASITEVACLCNLTALHIHIENMKCLTQEIPCLWRDLKEFCICVDKKYKHPKANRSMRLDISGPIENWAKVLLGKTERLSLAGRDNLKNVIHLNENGFQDLKSLSIRSCGKMKHIISSRVEEVPQNAFGALEDLKVKHMDELMNLCDGKLPVGSLQKLKKLKVHDCRSMSYLLSTSLVQNIQQLEYLEIRFCDKMERIISSKGKEMEVVEGIPSLPSSLSLENLRELNISECPNFKYLFTSSLASGLKKLEKLNVSKCKGMEVIIAKEKGVGDLSLFHQLRTLQLCELQGLSSFCEGLVCLDLSSLETIEVISCWKLKRLPLGLQSAPSLKKIRANKEWFQELEWGDNGNIKSRMQPLFEDREERRSHSTPPPEEGIRPRTKNIVAPKTMSA